MTGGCQRPRGYAGLRAPASPALSPALQAEKLQRGSNILPEVLLPLFSPSHHKPWTVLSPDALGIWSSLSAC